MTTSLEDAKKVEEADRDHMLGDLADAVRYDGLIEQMKLVAIVGARKHGATWQQIAEVLGVTHQGARSTWLPRIKALEKELKA